MASRQVASAMAGSGPAARRPGREGTRRPRARAPRHPADAALAEAAGAVIDHDREARPSPRLLVPPRPHCRRYRAAADSVLSDRRRAASASSGPRDGRCRPSAKSACCSGGRSRASRRPPQGEEVARASDVHAQPTEILRAAQHHAAPLGHDALRRARTDAGHAQEEVLGARSTSTGTPRDGPGPRPSSDRGPAGGCRRRRTAARRSGSGTAAAGARPGRGGIRARTAWAAASPSACPATGWKALKCAWWSRPCPSRRPTRPRISRSCSPWAPTTNCVVVPMRAAAIGTALEPRLARETPRQLEARQEIAGEVLLLGEAPHHVVARALEVHRHAVAEPRGLAHLVGLGARQDLEVDIAREALAPPQDMTASSMRSMARSARPGTPEVRKSPLTARRDAPR